MKKEYDDIVAHAKPKWVEEGRKEGHEEEREDNIKKNNTCNSIAWRNHSGCSKYIQYNA